MTIGPNPESLSGIGTVDACRAVGIGRAATVACGCRRAAIRAAGWLFLAHSRDHVWMGVSVLGDQAVADDQSAASVRGRRCAAPAGWIGFARLSALRRGGGYGTD